VFEVENGKGAQRQFPYFIVCYKGLPESERGKGILIMSSLRDVLEMKVSPTAVFHFVMNSSSDIGSLCKYSKYQKQSWDQTRNEGKNERRENVQNEPCTDAE
jgi:hypothetical protein